jgi:hypothetical protein
MDAKENGAEQKNYFVSKVRICGNTYEFITEGMVVPTANELKNVCYERKDRFIRPEFLSGEPL